MLKICSECNDLFNAARTDAKTCGTPCRMARSRRLRSIATHERSQGHAAVISPNAAHMSYRVAGGQIPYGHGRIGANR